MKNFWKSTIALGIGYAIFMLLGQFAGTELAKQRIEQDQIDDFSTLLQQMKKKANLPRRMDDVSVWTDIRYAKHTNSIIYVYEVDSNSREVSIADFQDAMKTMKTMNVELINAGDAPQNKYLLEQGFTLVSEYYGTDNAILGKWHINPSDIN